jgi:hypothetical protein
MLLAPHTSWGPRRRSFLLAGRCRPNERDGRGMMKPARNLTIPAVLILLAASADAVAGDEILVTRDSCAAVASSAISASARATSVEALRRRTKATYLELAKAPNVRLLALHKIEEPIDILIDTFGGRILDQVRGGMHTSNVEQVVQGVGYAMAFTAATCMAILLEQPE